MSGRRGDEKSLEMGSRGARSEGDPSVSGRQGVRSNRILRSSNSASAPPSRSKTSTDRLIAPKPSSVKSVGSSGSSRAPRDMSLAAYIRRIRVVASSCDEALERQKANFQEIPEELTALQDKIGGVLKLVEDMEGKGSPRTHALAPLSLRLLRAEGGGEGRRIETFVSLQLFFAGAARDKTPTKRFAGFTRNNEGESF